MNPLFHTGALQGYSSTMNDCGAWGQLDGCAGGKGHSSITKGPRTLGRADGSVPGYLTTCSFPSHPRLVPSSLLPPPPAVSRFLKRLEASSEGGAAPLDVHELLGRMTLEVIGRSAFGWVGWMKVPVGWMGG